MGKLVTRCQTTALKNHMLGCVYRSFGLKYYRGGHGSKSDFSFHQERQGKWVNIKHYHESLSVILTYPLGCVFFLIENKKYEIQFTGNEREWFKP